MTSTTRAKSSHRAVEAVLAGAAGLIAGLVLHLFAVWLRDHGPELGGWSLRGNGAAVVLPLAALLLIVGEVAWARRRAWVAMLLWPIGLIAGLFFVLGGF